MEVDENNVNSTNQRRGNTLGHKSQLKKQSSSTSVAKLTTKTQKNGNNRGARKVTYMYSGGRAPKTVARVQFRSSVRQISDYSFWGCNKLKRIVLNDGLEKIGDYAFIECTSLVSISFPSTLIEIGDNAFSGCISLREAVLNDGLKKIGNFAFDGCSSLQCITIPPSATKIHSQAFVNCIQLREVTLDEDSPNNAVNAVYHCQSVEHFKFSNISSRLESIIQTGHWPDMESKLTTIDPLAIVRGGDVLVSNRLLRGIRGDYNPFTMTSGIAIGSTDWLQVKAWFNRLVQLTLHYELKEATTLIELAMWKAKLDEVDDTNPSDRDACRVDMPGPAKDSILQFLSQEEVLPPVILQEGGISISTITAYSPQISHYT